MLKVISLDMDGTLVQPDFVNAVWQEGIPALYARRHKRDLAAAARLVQEAYDAVGQESKDWYDLRYWFRRFDIEGDLDQLMASYRDKISFFPEVQPVLNRLKEKYPLIVISNAAQEFLDIELEPVKDCFTHIFSCVSHFHRVKKDGSVYRDICQRLGLPPEEMCHVGDHYQFDYVAPSSLGIRACFVDRSGGVNRVAQASVPASGAQASLAVGLNTVKDLLEFEARLPFY